MFYNINDGSLEVHCNKKLCNLLKLYFPSFSMQIYIDAVRGPLQVLREEVIYANIKVIYFVAKLIYLGFGCLIKVLRCYKASFNI